MIKYFNKSLQIFFYWVPAAVLKRLHESKKIVKTQHDNFNLQRIL